LITGEGSKRAVIVFLASPDAAYLTGATIDVNGGSHLL
jgi:NAD(P)-dependent dehydrogenase (short-subunit alcohol dehydrogenase family)